jgi:superfamily I DNA and RNA helicase
VAASIEVKRKLYSARRDARINVVIDPELIKNDSEALLLTALIKAYGDSAAGFAYYSPGRARSNIRPPDVVLCHPDVGVLVIDAKGHKIEAIEKVEAGHIFVKYKGRIHPKNVVQQVQDQMFEIRSDSLKKIRDVRKLPLFNCMIAFPNIRESEWVEQGFDKACPMRDLLFRDQLETKARFKQRVGQLVQDTLKQSSKKEPLNSDQIDLLYQVFGNSSVINRHRPPRAYIDEDSLGCYVDEMEALDKYLSREQENLSRMRFEGSPRLVRGVAGSGKSVVLANIVARYMHRRMDSLEIPMFPQQEISIAVTCFNRALVDFLKQKIRLAYREQTMSDNIPSSVMLVRNFHSLMYALNHHRGWPLEDVDMDILYNDGPEKWAGIYRDQIKQFSEQSPEQYHACCFDAIFVDEGQDLGPIEYQLILDLVRPNEITGEKPIMIFYDDAQNIYGRSRPIWKDLNINVVGERSNVMRECFRNTRQIVELAFNVLLGSQAPTDVRVQTRTYADISYLKERGVIEEAGDHIRVGFAEREGRLPEIMSFSDQDKEIAWLTSEIVRLIKEENVRPEDILVLFRSKYYFNYTLLEEKIIAHLPDLEFIHPFGGSSDRDRYIFQPDKLTISTVNGAKGYDAPIVFIVGTDLFGDDKKGRAVFYVAATRAKLLLYISGTNGYHSLLTEAEAVSQML